VYWSPTRRDRRLDREDVENIAVAYDWLVDQRAIDATRSGLMGTYVGGSFALMAWEIAQY
jgi:dienelactone hydrolase